MPAEEHFSNNTSNTRNLDSKIVFSSTPPPDDDIEIDTAENSDLPIPTDDYNDDDEFKEFVANSQIIDEISDSKEVKVEFSDDKDKDNNDITIVDGIDDDTDTENIKFEFDDSINFEIFEVPKVILSNVVEVQEVEEEIKVQVQEETVCSIEKINCDETNNEEIHFEADFSAFEAHFPINEIVINQIDQLKENEGKEEKINQVELVLGDDDDDDDFGDFNDFNDFTQEQERVIEAIKEDTQIPIVIPLLKPDDISSIIDHMFPHKKDIQDVSLNTESIILKAFMDNVVQYLKDVDTTLALNYDYKDSSTNHILIKALGIDERNIVGHANF